VQDLLTTRQLQDVLKVDRTTIYRIVKRGELPAIRVGNQWRFPRREVEAWLHEHALLEAPAGAAGTAANGAFAELSPPDTAAGSGVAWDSSNAHFIFPIECVQRIQDAFAEILGVTILVTNTEGDELTRSSHSGGLWDLARTAPEVRVAYRAFWRDLGRQAAPDEELQADPVLGLLWCGALIRTGDEVRALVVVGGLVPREWPPSEERVSELAVRMALPETTLRRTIDQVHRLEEAGTAYLLPFSRRLGDILEHIVAERVEIVDRMESIAELTHLDT